VSHARLPSLTPSASFAAPPPAAFPCVPPALPPFPDAQPVARLADITHPCYCTLAFGQLTGLRLQCGVMLTPGKGRGRPQGGKGGQ
jgi:hypothetical protein